MIRAFVTLTLLCLAASVSAQTTTPDIPTSYDVLQFAAGLDPAVAMPTVVTTNVAATCNLAPTPAATGPVTNPGTLDFDDPVNAGRACRIARPLVPQNGSGFQVVLVANGPTGKSARSNVAGPFVLSPRAVPPVPPTGLSLRVP